MKKLCLMLTAFAAAFLMAGTSYGQNTGEIEWLSQLDKKTVVSYNDAVSLFIFQLGKKSSTFEQDSALLISQGIGLDGYTKDSLLTKGMLSKMTAKYLNLSGSLMYLIFNSERYAFKACIAKGIFTEDGSDYDKLSGSAMIETFSRISEIKGEQK